MDEIIKRTIRLPLKSLTELAALKEANKLMAEAKMTDVQQSAIRTAIIEAIINAVEHGDGAQKDLDIEFTVTPLELKVVVRDYGKGFEAASLPPVDFRKKRTGRKTRGWGLKLT